MKHNSNTLVKQTGAMDSDDCKLKIIFVSSVSFIKIQGIYFIGKHGLSVSVVFILIKLVLKLDKQNKLSEFFL